MSLLKVFIIVTVPSFSEWITVVAGGHNGTAPLATATMYRNGRTVALPDLPHAVYDHSLTVYKDKVRLCGGHTNGRNSNECFQLDVFQTSPK